MRVKKTKVAEKRETVKEGREWCLQCRAYTQWKFTRDKSAVMCGEGCGSRFPCKKACEHLDCEQVIEDRRA